MSLTIQNYSERSVVVFGEDTKKYKDKLKELGGKYNSNLSIGPGWIFSIKKKDEITSWMNTIPSSSLCDTKIYYNYIDDKKINVILIYYNKDKEFFQMHYIEQNSEIKHLISTNMNDFTEILSIINSSTRIPTILKEDLINLI